MGAIAAVALGWLRDGRPRGHPRWAIIVMIVVPVLLTLGPLWLYASLHTYGDF